MPKNYKNLESGQFLQLTGQNKEEKLNLPQKVPLAFLLSLLFLKLKNVQKLEDRRTKVDKFDEKLIQRPKLKNCDTALECIHLFIMGNKDTLKENLQVNSKELNILFRRWRHSHA